MIPEYRSEEKIYLVCNYILVLEYIQTPSIVQITLISFLRVLLD